MPITSANPRFAEPAKLRQPLWPNDLQWPLSGRLRVHRDFQDQLRKRAAARWHDNDLVFAFRVGTTLYAGNVRRSGHRGTVTADTVYRKQIRSVVMGCAQVVDSLFPAATAYADPC